MPFLLTEKLTKRFGGLTAVDSVNYEVKEGQLSAIIGPNGAGKTTFFNLLCGLITPTEGKIIFKDEDITELPAHKRVSKGIAKTFQISSLFNNLTVIDNVIMSIQRDRRSNITDYVFGSWRKKEYADRAEEILERVGLGEEKYNRAGNLTHGQRTLLEIALTTSLEPELILLDEPTGGLTLDESFKIMNMIRELTRKMTVILVEHKMSIVMNFAQRISVMNKGQIIAEGTPDEIQNNELVRQVYLGEKA
jgi:branched-chain amino acid transport system ATP-binding protein